MRKEFKTVLKNQFGFTTFRPGQLDAICTLMEKKRLLCIQPTGHGKSLLYQLPAVVLNGITIVISPLLALIRDQIMQLEKRFSISAASINSDQTDDENKSIRNNAKNGKLKILFVSPEQLDNVFRFEFLLDLPVSLIVVDEAHCISTWGHDFRPSYRLIIHLLTALEKKHPSIKILALTATANAKTEKDITQQLVTSGHKIPVHRESMNRPNINLAVFKTKGLTEKLYYIEKLVTQFKGNGLIYCATRDNTHLVSDYLQYKKINAAAYHAGLDADLKKKLQHEFSESKYKVITATNALGMGIDKSDLRFIIHFDMPGSITSYYQEVGRCGRDGLSANGILLFDEKDKHIQEYFISSAQPTEIHFRKILSDVKNSTISLRSSDIKRLSGFHSTIVTLVIAELVEQGYLKKVLKGQNQVYLHTEKKGTPNLTRYEDQHKMKNDELQAMLQYGEKTNRCRMKILRSALGDVNANDCNRCDVCTSEWSKIPAEKPASICQWIAQRKA